jgi:hypothetical protein
MAAAVNRHCRTGHLVIETILHVAGIRLAAAVTVSTRADEPFFRGVEPRGPQRARLRVGVGIGAQPQPYRRRDARELQLIAPPTSLMSVVGEARRDYFAFVNFSATCASWSGDTTADWLASRI